MAKQKPEIEQAFREAALRSTTRRYAVLGFLEKSAVHTTADEISAAINRRNPMASRARAYNSLRSLSKAGLVREVLAEGKRSGSTPTSAGTITSCQECGAVEDIGWFDLPHSSKASAGGRKIRSYQIIFRGACTRCAAGARR